MKFIFYFFIYLCLFFCSISVHAMNSVSLKKCWNKQVKPLEKYYVKLQFTEENNEFYHSFAPWDILKNNTTGVVWFNANDFIKTDTLSKGTRKYFSQTYFKKDTLLFVDYGSKELSVINKSRYIEELFNTLRYTPVLMLSYFFNHQQNIIKTSDVHHLIFQTKINNTKVAVHINKENYLVDKIVTLSYSSLYGDVQDVYHYKNYIKREHIHYPSKVSVVKLNGKLNDEINTMFVAEEVKVNNPLITPKNYAIKSDTVITPHVSIDKYNDHIYFISLHHSDDKVLLVNFKDFLLVAEAPLSSKNGELIISEAKKIAPNKPIRYFVYGHFHNHYIAGVRAFVHKGAEIIHAKYSAAYLTYLVNAKHSIEPDSLELEPRALKGKEVNDSLWISDGSYSMCIYFIGEQSAHTQDYLMYYFPKEKILFEDDLVWIEQEGTIKKASKRQAGLYQAIKDRSIKVETIIQSWPLKSYGVKTIIPLKDLEQSIKN